jgi:uncharacterized phage protein (TIGR01671 family)
MREIKFRAWDKEYNVMSEVTEIFFDSKVVKIQRIMPSKWLNIYLQIFNNIELMQYTGLKDKNGKEIYEGDILHCEGHWNLYTVWDEENARFAFLCTDWVVTQGHPIQPHISSYAIIGNIYENPELLGGK